MTSEMEDAFAYKNKLLGRDEIEEKNKLIFSLALNNLNILDTDITVL